MRKIKFVSLFFLLMFSLSVLLGGCGNDSNNSADSPEKEVPTLNMGYIFTTHHEPFMVALSEGEKMKDLGVYLNPVVEKEKYELIVNDEKVANLNIIVAKSGSETATLFAQEHLDLALASVTAMMSAVDKDTPVKILSPIQTEGMAMVFPADSQVSDWDSFIDCVNAASGPIKMGYHSPSSAPKILTETALNEAGLSLTHDANDLSADILLVDLKSTSNLIPALTSKQVDCWVGPAPLPEVAETEGVGKIAFALRDMPPEGKWHNCPCCVLAAREAIIEQNHDELAVIISLIDKYSQWCNENKDEAANIAADWLGMSPEAVKRAEIYYTIEPDENWMNSISVYLDSLNGINKYDGKLKDKKLDEVKAELFDFQFVE